jgi:short subunit dehydrogenase-like uncharacterized protein
MTRRVLLYGATGFTGRIIAKRLTEIGHDVVLAGRDGPRLSALGETLGLPTRVFGLDDPARIEHGLADIHVVLNAAGPFAQTASVMIDACIRTRTHYLDIAGEWPVFVLAQSRSRKAAAAGVMLMPGVGFSIVASDCLLAYATAHANDITLLRVAISRPAVMSRGTLRSSLTMTSGTVMVRRHGNLCRLPAGKLEKSFDFGEGLRTCVAVSWPDVVTGQHTAGVASIEAYVEVGLGTRMLHQGGVMAANLFDDGVVQQWLPLMSALWPGAPPEPARRQASQIIVAEAVDRWRRSKYFRLRTADGYAVTAVTASTIIGRVLDADWAPGFQTPAGLYGSDLIAGLGCGRFDNAPTAGVF